MNIEKRESMLIAEEHNEEGKFWNQKFKDITYVPDFIYDYNEIDNNKPILREKNYYLCDKVSNKFIVMSNGSDYKLHIILTAAIAILLRRGMDTDDIIIATPIYKQEVEANFINTILVLKNNIQDRMTFKDVIFEVRKNIIEANKNANYPIRIILNKFKDNNCKLVNTSVLLENIHKKEYLNDSEFNLKFIFNRDKSIIKLSLQYNSCVYKEETIERIFKMFSTMCKNILSNVELIVKDIEIIPQEDKNKLLYEFNKKIDFNIYKTIHEFAEDYAKSMPKKIAFEYKNLQITYEELNKKANQIARSLPQNKTGCLL